MRPIICDVQTGAFTHIASPSSQFSIDISDVHLDIVLAVLTSPAQAPVVLRATLNDDVEGGVALKERIGFKKPSKKELSRCNK
jgi:hypothetical protein